MKEEALKLADELEEFYVDPDGFPYMIHESATMIRRLVEEVDALNAKESMWQEMIEDLECQVIKYKQGKPFHDFNTLTLDTGEKRSLKPLSDEKITQCLNESMDIKGVWGQPMMELNPVNFARAIEESHGIK